MTGSVPRVSIPRLPPEVFTREFQVPGKPVVVSGALPALADWDLAFLARQLGDSPVPVRYFGADHRRIPRHEWTRYSAAHVHVPFDQYVEMLADGSAERNDRYVARVPVRDMPFAQTLTETVERVARTLGLRRIPGYALNLWLGPPGHVEPLHFDDGDGTLFHVRGRKRVFLFPPDQSANLYPFPYVGGVAPWMSRVNHDRPDFRAFPRLAGALEHRRQTDLGPGDMLFIPAGWWHEVVCLEGGYALSFNRLWRVRPLRRIFRSRRLGTFFFLRLIPGAFPVVMSLGRGRRSA